MRRIGALWSTRWLVSAGALSLCGCPELNPNFMGSSGSSGTTSNSTGGSTNASGSGTLDAGGSGGGSSGTSSADETASSDTSSAVCGNGVLETNEQCDGRELDGQTCNGVLACAEDCTFDAAGCCEPAPAQRNTCPEEFCNGCEDQEPCRANCNQDNECEGDEIDCPDGFDCDIDCTGVEACVDATINCPSEHACTVNCSASAACRGATVNCGAGPCTIECSDDDNTCDAVVNCGFGECTATCAGDNAPTLACGSACLCDPC